MSKYFDAIIVALIAGTISYAAAIHTRAKKAEYEYYVFAKHLVHHQLEEKGCKYIEREQTDE